MILKFTWLNLILLGILILKSSADPSSEGKVINSKTVAVKFEDDGKDGEIDEGLIRSISKRDSSKHFELATRKCGSSKSCYVSLKTCDEDPKTCNFALSWDYDGATINYELLALSNTWTGVLFSEDKKLGNDNLIVCLKDASSDSVSVLHYFKNSSDSDLVKLSEPDDNIVRRQGLYSPDGYIYCKFSRPKSSHNSLITDLNKPHFIYVERGSPGELINEKINKNFQSSEAKINFASSIYVPTSSRSWLVKVHAILGIIAWIFLGSIGILLARYYKPMWPNHVMASFRVWFSFHRPIMIFVTLLTLLSFLFALIELEWEWSVDGNELTHMILGLIVIVCSLINPLLGFFRPKPDRCGRCLFFWFHWLVGNIAYCLAVPCIFIGMDLSKSDIPNWCAWLLFAWVIFHIVTEIILEVHYCCTFRQNGQYSEINQDYDKTTKKTKKLDNAPGYRWKPTLLFIYTIITAIVVSALIIGIVLFDF